MINYYGLSNDMNENIVPELLEEEITQHYKVAEDSIRKRSPKILHEKGDYLNKVFNFILEDSYMHPHLHPGEEKIEKMHLIQGSFALVIFDAISSSLSQLLAVRISLAPSLSRFSAKHCPIPDEAPVINMVLFLYIFILL